MLRSNMRRALSLGILACLLLSLATPIAKYTPVEIIVEEINPNPRIIDDSELTLGQIEALNSVGMSRSANTNWSATGGSNEVDEIYEMVFDSQGNIIVCGTIYQVSQFGAITVYTQGEGDILIAKLSKDGTWLWAVSTGTATYYDECRGVTVDSNDDVYGTGYFQGSVDFNGTVITTTGFDGWVARVNSTGQFDWAMKFGGFDVDVGWDVVADNYDNLYVTGYYQNLTEFNTSQLVDYTQSGNSKFFVAYYNFSAQGWDWAKHSTGAGTSVPFQLVHESSTNSVYIAGYNTGSEQWENGGFTSSPAGTWAGFVVKYADNGSLLWGRYTDSTQCVLGSNCGVYFNNIVMHPFGGIVVGGNYVQNYKQQGGAVKAGFGDWDVLVLRYDENGTQLWTFGAGSGGDDRIQSLSVNLKGQVQFGGNHIANMTFDNYNLGMNYSNGYYDGFIAQLDNNSDFQWALSIGGVGNDTVGALLTFSDGSVLAGGDFSGTVWFGNTPKTASDSDIFVWKFQHDKDGDGIRDYVDNCLNKPNSNQSNYDQDLRGDECDNDDDNDGLHDVLDDCQYGFTNWNQSNTSLDHDSDGCNDIEDDLDDDNDGILDIDDNCPTGVLDWTVDNSTDLDNDGCRDSDEDLDDDGDGVLDVNDNCQFMVNPLQEDFELDGIGDICDSDDDGDGLSDIIDDCPQGATNWTSEFQTDKDSDGCEDENSNEDPDDDNDGILDEFDECPRGETDWISSQNNDRDGDGCRNDNEDNDNDNDSIINEVDQCKNGITDWRKNATNDNDGDGCLDDREDNDDDNDGFSDSVDFCPLQEGTATQGGAKGCPDFDSDGWADLVDDFLQDETQWSDGDGDGFGDNPLGTNPDDCPFFFGNSTQDRTGCIDSDGDGYSDPEVAWTVAMGADAFVDEPSQWADADGDGYGDNFDGVNVDFCTDKAGTSTIDRFGCPDLDGDGYSDPDAFWAEDKWTSLGYGPDIFIFDPTQWYDTDKDGFGDNWGNPAWNKSRDPSWPGVFVENATSADMCPLVSPDGRFDDDINYPGCLLNEPSDGGKSLTDDSAESSDDSGLDTFTLIGIIGGVVVLALVGVIVVLLKKKPEPKKKKSSPKPLTNLPAPDAPAPAPLPLSEDVDEYGDEAEDENTVGSWEDLPAGDYLDPDENGTNWFKANDGDHWYQNSDGTWTKWQD
ncbi:MAG: hypothetical protein CMB57_03360 [Euryarchaeota archaeon]|nr:hypothetical protein [Euryarchaeota archaeon]